jgi:hypothetical protein
MVQKSEKRTLRSFWHESGLATIPDFIKSLSTTQNIMHKSPLKEEFSAVRGSRHPRGQCTLHANSIAFSRTLKKHSDIILLGVYTWSYYSAPNQSGLHRLPRKIGEKKIRNRVPLDENMHCQKVFTCLPLHLYNIVHLLFQKIGALDNLTFTLLWGWIMRDAAASIDQNEDTTTSLRNISFVYNKI